MNPPLTYRQEKLTIPDLMFNVHFYAIGFIVIGSFYK